MSMHSFLLFIISMYFIAGCGQVTEQEATIAYLPEGEDNAAWVGEKDDEDDIDESKDEIDDESEGQVEEEDENLIGIAAVVAEMSKRKSECSGNKCDFEIEHEVVDAIVTWASKCSDCDKSENLEVRLHDLENSTGFLMYFNKQSEGPATELKLGDKVSLKVKKFTWYYGLAEVTEIDQSSVSVSSPSTIELISFFQNIKDFGELDFDNLDGEPNSLYHGFFKIIDATHRTYNSTYTAHTINYKEDKFVFLRENTDVDDYNIGDCFHVKNMIIYYTFNKYTIDDRKMTEISAIEPVDCAIAGL